jgi:hypothetical protein
MHPRIRMFLLERDRAYARGDSGVVKSMNAELRRLGVSDEATLANPTGKHVKTAGPAVLDPKPVGRPKLPRCEHENIADRCEICNPELAAH